MDAYLIISIIEWFFCVALTLLIFMLYREQAHSTDLAINTRNTIAAQTHLIGKQAARIKALESTPQSKYRQKQELKNQKN